jgi:hypothetical protein
MRVADADDSIISENFIDTSIGAGITLYHTMVSTVIKNNRIVNTARAAIHLTAAVTAAKHIEFAGNYIDNSASSGDGICLYNVDVPAERLLIRDNIIKGRRGTDCNTGIWTGKSFTGAIERNIVDGWHIAVDFSTSAIAERIGSEVTFNFNTLSNSNVAVSYYLYKDKYAFAMGNKYENNFIQEQAVKGYANYRNATSLAPQKVFYDSSPPSGGTWKQGDMIYNTHPGAASPNNVIGWVCTVSPGTWKAFGQIS